MATTYEIIQAISQVVANTHDGALDDKGEAIKIGLKREKGHPITDSRVMDGFGVTFSGDKLILKYQGEIKVKDVHANGFENDILGLTKSICKYLKKEYKKVTGKALTLTLVGEHDILVQKASNVRAWVQATCVYKIGGMKDIDNPAGSEDRVSDAIKKFLAIGKQKYSGAKP